MRKRLSLILALLTIFTGLAMAQNTVSGVVVSEDDGEPVIGATVTVKGTKVATVTDIDGKFSLATSTASP